MDRMLKTACCTTVGFFAENKVLFTSLTVLSTLALVFQGPIENMIGFKIDIWLGIFLFILTLPGVVGTFKLWRFLPPNYYGLDKLYDELSAEKDFASGWFQKSSGRIIIDCHCILKAFENVLERMVFTGCDHTLNKDCARINAEAFAGSQFGTGETEKFKRNSAISKVNPITFSLLRSEHRDVFTGLTAVIPMHSSSAAAYQQGMLRDNNFNEHVVAGPLEPFQLIVPLLIAKAPRNKFIGDDNLCNRELCMDLIKAVLLQTVILATFGKSSNPVEVLAQNSRRTFEKFFNRMSLLEAKHYISGDQEKFFATLVTFNNKKKARKLIKSRYPEIANYFRGND